MSVLVTQWGVTVFPILAAIRVDRFASAIAFWNFMRTFAQVRDALFLGSGICPASSVSVRTIASIER